MLTRTFIAFIFFLILSGSVLAATYNVGSGRQYSSVQACADVANPGDTCLVYPGTYEEEVFTKRSGSSGNMITFKAQGNAVLRKFSVDHDYIRIEGFEFTNMNSSFTGDAINMKGKYNEIINNYFHHLEGAYDGIDPKDGKPEYRSAKGVDCSKSSGCDYSLIKGNRIEWVHSAGIYIYGTGVIVEDNEISNVVQRFSTAHSPHFDADGIRFFGTDHIIRNNYIHDITNDKYAPDAHADCFQTYDNSAPSTQNILITNNVCRNVGHQCIMASQGTKGNGNKIIFTNNVCDNNGGQAVNIQNFPNSVINNNVFYKNIQYRAVYIRLGNTNTEVKNNIFYGPLGNTIQKDSSSSSGFSADYNLIYNIDGNHISGPNDVSGDPLFVNPAAGDFRVKDGSPACGAGEGGIDIGAFPCGTSSTCTDNDGDGYGQGCSLGSDCNDNNPNINPGVQEICGNNIDEDCNGFDVQCTGFNPDTNGDGCVSLNEIVAYVELWQNGQVTIAQVVAGVEQWQLGCP